MTNVRDTKETSVFQYNDYKEYLRAVLQTTGSSRGIRSELASKLNCQSAFISQILNSHVHFSLEHAIQVSQFLSHTSDESNYFMLLVHLGRAGSVKLEEYYRGSIKEIQERRQKIGERIKSQQKLSKEAQVRYYSSWTYAAIHVLLSISKFQTKLEIAEYLGLSAQTVSRCLEFLTEEGLAIPKAGKYEIGKSRIHLGTESPLLKRHHINWKLKAIDAYDEPDPNDLHYSSVITLSQADGARVNKLILELIEKSEKILKETDPEAPFCLSIDLFKV
ncbi:MAG: TIGR02147 family protein [Bdellovibrionota bacterium]